MHTSAPGNGQRHVPVRTCVGCRARTSAVELLRVVAEVGGSGPVAVPDPRHRRPGRGAWLHPDPACLRLAERRRAFPRALRVPGSLDTAAVQHHLSTGQPPAVAQDMTDAGSVPRQATEGKQVDPS
ncbi:YlxR family protein [Saccharopolyspora karakumensis]|uniref:YlxR family protein n=1 Tax=Saccharopolyspora karakumensis TaxID=2530386 RepID=A0A4R5BII9_9PSEU|nr:YlxR family protein [Saccharopolyspora karakumensis]